MSSRVDSEAPFSSNYLEYVAKVSTPEKKENLADDFSPLESRGRLCGVWATMGECENGHKFAKALDCGREWCGECRETSHRRRFGRWLSKAFKIEEMGYLVVTFEGDKRPRKKEDFRQIGQVIKDVLMALGFGRGFRRWHWFGNKTDIWNPHLNFLLESGYLEPEFFALIKEQIREAIGVENAVIYYHYSDKIGKKIHWLKYVTRSTFLKRWWDLDMADELKNFRNCVSWGKWEDEDKWGLPDHEKIYGYIAKIEMSVCPCCGSKIHWSKTLHLDDLAVLDYQQIWLKVWQARPPPSKVLVFDLLRALNRDLKEKESGGVC